MTMTTPTTPAAPTSSPALPAITVQHLRDALNIDGALILTRCPTTNTARVAVIGRRPRPGERLLATADAISVFYRHVGDLPTAATALSAALHAVTTGRLL